MNDNSKKVFNFVKEHDGEDFTAQDIADALQMKVRSVNGSITTNGSSGSLNRLCIKNTAKEYLDKNLTKKEEDKLRNKMCD